MRKESLAMQRLMSLGCIGAVRLGHQPIPWKYWPEETRMSRGTEWITRRALARLICGACGQSIWIEEGGRWGDLLLYGELITRRCPKSRKKKTLPKTKKVIDSRGRMGDN